MIIKDHPLKINKIYCDKALYDQSKVLIFYGGAGSGKSYFAAQKVLLRCLNEKPHKILVLRKVSRTIKDSVFSLLKEVMVQMNCYHKFTINNTEYRFRHTNGNEIICKGLDEPEKIKSIQGITSMWLEEATEFTHEDFLQLTLRIRGELHNYVQYMMTFNPISEYHWIKERGQDNTPKGWKFIHTTYEDNSYLTDEYKESLRQLKETNFLYYQVYCLGEWGVEDKSGKFCYAFDANKHVGKTELNKGEYVYLSFDFNVDPITCGVIQHYEETIHVVEQIKLSNSNVYELCNYIKAAYPQQTFIVTGDATGRARSAMTKDQLNYYKIIKQELRLSDGQIQVPSVNPKIEDNKVLVNALLQNYKIIIDEEKADSLVYDMKYVEVDEFNKIKKDQRTDKKQQADALDTFRYYCNKFHKNFLKIPQF